jgi:cadmium resistance protein CadD (predicted permease)
MTELLGIIPVTVAAFAGTNLDNVLLLIALLSAGGIRRRQVIGGYLFAMFLLLGISFAVGKAAELVPAGYLGYLGIVPFSLGIISLIRLIPGDQSGPADPEPKLRSASSVFVATTLIQLSNSADTLATFSVLLAESTVIADGLILITYMGMVAMACATALFFLKYRRIGAVMERIGRYLTPLILLAVGAYILSDTVTDTDTDTASFQESSMEVMNPL